MATMTDRIISAHYDTEADALQINLEPVYRVDCTTEAEPERIMLDWRADEVVGIEILSPTRPLRLARIAAENGFAHLLDDIYIVAGNAMSVQISGNAKLGVVEAHWKVRA
jgi:uncharacterized protein YuzE